MQQIERRTARLGARPGRRPSHGEAGLPQARRAANRELAPGDLRCECGRSGCRAAVPAYALDDRRARRGFVVFPGHQGQEVVLAAADRFFIVELTQKQRSWS
jgi:hypothetical protein